MSSRSPNHTATKTTYALVGTVLLVAGLFYLRFGYQYGFSDQDEFIPLVLKWMNSSLFETDWFVESQLSAFTVRTAFAGIVYFFAQFLGVKLAVLLVHCVTGIGLVWGLTRVSNRLYHNELSSFVFVFLVLVMAPRWNPGGNDIWHAMLVPSTLAWTCAVWSLDQMMGRRFLSSGLLIAAAMVVHPLIGLQLGCILGTVALWKHGGRARWFIIPFLTIAIPSIIVFSGSSEPQGTLSATYILTTLRAPHHYLPEAFSAVSWVKWLIITVPGFFYLWTDNNSIKRSRIGNRPIGNVPISDGPSRDWILGLAVVSSIVVLLGLLFGTVLPIPSIIKLQPFTIAVWIRVLASLGLSALIIAYMPFGIKTYLERFVKRPTFVVLALVMVFGIPLISSTDRAVEGQLDSDTANWIQENTPVGALFAIPPSLSGFQIQTQRAQFVNFKAFPFQGNEATEWLDRLLTIAPVEQLEPGGTALQSRLDQAFDNLTPTQWDSIHVRANIDYLVRRAHSVSEWETHPNAWCSTQWCVYDLTSPPINGF
ncbi:hypothetical protein HQ496_06175 [bacterium]|nr:hypothetical protein [bacterium]